MKVFPVQLDTNKTGVIYAGVMGMSDYNMHRIDISVYHDGEILDLTNFSDIALHYSTSDGHKGTYRLANDNCLTVSGHILSFSIPFTVVKVPSSVTMQVQLFSDDRRLSLLNRFILEVKNVMAGKYKGVEEEVLPVIDEIYMLINKRLDKEAGGTVSGAVNFIGDFTVKGKAFPEPITNEELEAILR